MFQKRVTEPSVHLCAVVWKHGDTEFTKQTAYHLVPFHRLAPSSGEEWLQRCVVTVMNGSPPCLCASVFQKRVTEHQSFDARSFGNTEAQSSQSKQPTIQSHSTVWRRVATRMRSNRNEWFPSVPLCLCVSNPTQKPTHLRFVYIDYPLFASPRTAFLPHRRNSQRCKPAAVFSK